MRFGSLLALAPLLGGVLAQQSSVQCDTEAKICFQGMTDAVHGVSYRVVFPPLVTSGSNSTEFIGEIVAPIAVKWAAMALGGAMLTNPLIMAWPNAGSFVVSPRWATTYDQPLSYSGVTVTTLPSSTINSTHWKWVFRCQSCTTWTGGSGGMDIGGTPVFAWAMSTVAVDTPSSATSTFAEHTDFGFWGNQVNLAHDSNYNDYLDGYGSGGATTGTPTSTSTTAGPTATTVPPASDYIIVGSGYGGIIAADRISATGKKVLLLERGGPSTYETGGRELPPWGSTSQYTRFDVPGLFESMFGASNPYWWCKDVGVIGGCLVGGGGSVNSALYWIPPDFEYAASNGWPSGWNNISTYVAKVLARLPSNDDPSTDGIRYVDQVYTLISKFLNYQGYSNITINSNPNFKDHAFGHPAYDFIDGKRGGPVATYLRTAKARSNFQLKIYTYVTALVRTKGQITGVRTNDTSVKDGIYPLTAKGRVILSAGTFGSARLLIQSGIGPTDQINVVAGHATQSQFLPPTADWINLPVGYNVMDNPSVNLIFTDPSIDSYDNWDYNTIWANPRPADAALYLKSRSGPFAQSSVRANFWRAYSSPDNITRWMQGTSRPGGYGIQTNLPYNTSNLWMITTYLSTGFTSRGRIGLDAAMNAKLLVQPWWQDPIDKQVHVQALTDLVNNLKAAIPTTTMITPDSTTTLKAYVDSYDPSAMNSNHWMGSCKIGVVVDTNVKVIGTNNLFVIDASIFPGMPMGNPHGSIMVASEMAVDKVLNLAGGP